MSSPLSHRDMVSHFPVGSERVAVFSATYNRYVLAILTLAYALSQVDQSLIGLVLQPIQSELRLTDTQLGFVTGIAFGLFYATLGLPVARWADRSNRSGIAALAVGLWGVTVMSCLSVSSFVQLVFSRMSAAAAAAACMPPTYSLVGDYFPGAAARTRAMAIYMLANPLSGFGGYVLGGWLTEHFGWRLALFLVGVLGVATAALIRLTVAETRVNGLGTPEWERAQPSWRQVLSAVWHQASSRHLGIAIVLVFTMGWGLNSWYAAVMIRNHGMGTAELGLWLGMIFGVSGVVGSLLGGYVANRWFSGNEQGQMRLIVVVMAANAPLLALFLLLPEKHEALAALGAWALVASSFYGPAFAVMQRLVVAEMRATYLALVMLFANLIGIGLGSQLVGLLSDWLRPALGSDSLRYAMVAVSLVGSWSAYHFWRVGRTVRSDLLAVAEAGPGGAPLVGPLQSL